MFLTTRLETDFECSALDCTCRADKAVWGRSGTDLPRQVHTIALCCVVRRCSGIDLMVWASGESDVLVADVPTAFPFHRDGRLRPLTTTGRNPLAALPSVATVREQGLISNDFSAWNAPFVPVRTPAPVIEIPQGLLREVARSEYLDDVAIIKGSVAKTEWMFASNVICRPASGPVSACKK